MTDVDLEREAEAEGGVFLLVVAFVVLEVDGNGGITAEEAAFSAAAAAAAAFLPLVPGLARGLGTGAVLKLPAAAALAFGL